MAALSSPTAGNIELTKMIQGFNTIGTFMVPGFLAAYYFSYPSTDFLRINHLPRRVLVVFVIILIMTMAGTTVSDGLYRLTKNMDLSMLPESLRQALKSSEVMMTESIEAFLQMNSFREFLGVFVVLAVLPALCEETMFRGALQPILKRGFRSAHLSVWVTGFLFAMLHMQFYTFLSIFALGVVLGYLREWSNSLWPSVVMHLVNNGSIVVAVYFFNIPFSEANELAGQWQWQYMLPLLGVFVACLFLLRRILKS